MGTTTYLPDAVQWSEGLLLSPQHLQQNDIYWHANLRHRLARITPHYWGVSKLTIDRASLVKGHITVTELDCILPDGLAVEFPGNYPTRTLDVDVGKLVGNEGRPVRVWAQVRERGAAAARMDNADRRYDSLPGVMTPDENTGDGDIQVGRLRPVISLYADDASKPAPAGDGACPLLEVVRDAQGRLRITDYHPPMLQLDASAFQDEQSLQRHLTQLTQRLWAKLDELSDGRGDDKAEDDSPAGSQLRQHLQAARCLASALPQLEIGVTAQQTHPNELYRALALVVGQAAALGGNPVPLKMTPYLHEDCMPQFRAVLDYIDTKLALVNTDYECLQFARIGDAGFARRLPSDITGEVIVELKPREGQSLADMMRWLADARIASDHLMPLVRQRRLPGALTRALSAQEIRERNLRPQAALFLIQNQKIEVEGKGLQDVFRADLSLLIQGAANAQMPAAIILHRKKQPRHGSVAPETQARTAEEIHA